VLVVLTTVMAIMVTTLRHLEVILPATTTIIINRIPRFYFIKVQSKKIFDKKAKLEQGRIFFHLSR